MSTGVGMRKDGRLHRKRCGEADVGIVKSVRIGVWRGEGKNPEGRTKMGGWVKSVGEDGKS